MGHYSALWALAIAVVAEGALLVVLVLWAKMHRRVHRWLHARLPGVKARRREHRKQVAHAIEKLRDADLGRRAAACDDLTELPPLDESIDQLAALAADASAPQPLRTRAVGALATMLRREARRNL